jgi:hypothetical protein
MLVVANLLPEIVDRGVQVFPGRHDGILNLRRTLQGVFRDFPSEGFSSIFSPPTSEEEKL